jgi:hypothetical protein
MSVRQHVLCPKLLHGFRVLYFVLEIYTKSLSERIYFGSYIFSAKRALHHADIKSYKFSHKRLIVQKKIVHIQ